MRSGAANRGPEGADHTSIGARRTLPKRFPRKAIHRGSAARSNRPCTKRRAWRERRGGSMTAGPGSRGRSRRGNPTNHSTVQAMTIINRALHKVYTRRAGEVGAGAPAGDAVRGWASELRSPAPQEEGALREAANARIAESVAKVAAGPIVAPKPVHPAVTDRPAAPPGPRVRIDDGHVPATTFA